MISYDNFNSEDKSEGLILHNNFNSESKSEILIIHEDFGECKSKVSISPEHNFSGKLTHKKPEVS